MAKSAEETDNGVKVTYEDKGEEKTIYFICTGNSCRSQMAEGWGKEILGEGWNVYSAGIETHGVNPKAIEA
ncbi:arsenate reductase/protein-tyrosine-phosphatase family protein, partial [Staphylococcus aureus]|uniref:arsenate reductase/protein-tyrosine-phosphatase family protein n=1 Tax=Staphylococcus aureus TaxID=1280 RepID=UPI003F9970FA